MNQTWTHILAFVLGVGLTVGGYELLGSEPEPPPKPEITAKAKGPKARRMPQARMAKGRKGKRGKMRQGAGGGTPNPAAMKLMKQLKSLPLHEQELLKEHAQAYLAEQGVEKFVELDQDQRMELAESSFEALQESREAEAAAMSAPGTLPEPAVGEDDGADLGDVEPDTPEVPDEGLDDPVE